MLTMAHSSLLLSLHQVHQLHSPKEHLMRDALQVHGLFYIAITNTIDFQKPATAQQTFFSDKCPTLDTKFGHDTRPQAESI